MDEKVLNAALAGLLHDVGKVEQRARPDPWQAPPNVNNAGLPIHARWSVYFAQTHVPPQPHIIRRDAAELGLVGGVLRAREDHLSGRGGRSSNGNGDEGRVCPITGRDGFQN